MYSLVYKLYFLLKRKQKYDREQGRNTNKFIQKVIDRIEWYYNILMARIYEKYSVLKNGINNTCREEKVIISLTSFPKRINNVWLTIETLMRQTMKPDEIILWLADSQFASIESLPKKLQDLQKRGLTIRFCDDLKSHKKYFYAMQEYDEDIIILVDDDMFYPYDTIEKLMKMHEKYPNDVCTITAQAMEQKKLPSEWKNPKLGKKYEHSDKIQIFSGSGSLYPPHSICKEAFDKKAIQSYCPYADDLWLTYMALKNNTKITMQNPWRAFPVTIYGTGAGSLYYINAEAGQNDEQWKKIIEWDRGYKWDV